MRCSCAACLSAGACGHGDELPVSCSVRLACVSDTPGFLGAARLWVSATTGFNMEDFRYRKTAISVLDCGEMVMENPARYAVLLGKLNAIVLVVDAALPETWERSSRDLKAALEHCPLARAILVFCNKMDLPEARSPSVVTDALNVSSFSRHGFPRALRCTSVQAETELTAAASAR